MDLATHAMVVPAQIVCHVRIQANSYAQMGPAELVQVGLMAILQLATVLHATVHALHATEDQAQIVFHAMVRIISSTILAHPHVQVHTSKIPTISVLHATLHVSRVMDQQRVIAYHVVAQIISSIIHA